MSFGYDPAGSFGDRADAESWAKRNNVDLRDLHLRDTPGGVEASIRKSTRNDDRFNDGYGNRRDGFTR
jgi:hypothetical protein